MTDVLILNTAVADFRRADFDFVTHRVGEGGLAKLRTDEMPGYTQEQYQRWIQEGFAATGGPGNTAPLLRRAGIQTAVGVNLGAGAYNGLDAQGRFFYDQMTANGIDMSSTYIHPELPTGTTFLHDAPGGDRGGIAYYPNANNDFDFERFKAAVQTLRPRIVYYMYSGLSDRGDAHGGKDLAKFITWCKGQNAVTIVDSHTLTGNPQEVIRSGKTVPEYRLLEPLLPELDIFFTSADEAKMILNTLTGPRDWSSKSEHENHLDFLHYMLETFGNANGRTRFFGVTVSSGAYHGAVTPTGEILTPRKTESKFMAGETVDLVGAGDSFRAGLMTYIARNLPAFQDGSMDFAQAVQMGNLMASLYIKAPLHDRYANIRPYEKLLELVTSDRRYRNFSDIQKTLGT